MRLRSWTPGTVSVLALLTVVGCAKQPAPRTAPAPTPGAAAPAAGGAAGGPAAAGARPSAPTAGPKPYKDVITAKAQTRKGLITSHRIDDKLFLELAPSALNVEMMVIARAVESTLQDPGGFFGGGANALVRWERQGNSLVLRRRSYGLTADPTDNIYRQVKGFQNGPVLAKLDIAAFNPADSAAVVDATDFFLTAGPALGGLTGASRNQSWFDHVASFPENLEVEITQTGNARAPGAPATAQPTPQTVRLHWSWRKLPDVPMMARYSDPRVGYISTQYYDFSSREHTSEIKRIIHRFKLVPKDTAAFRRGELVEPVEPIIYWIDPATPEWMKPWVKVGVDKWDVAFREAGFKNAIRGEYAPADNPDWSIYDLRHSIIYWRPSTVPNATGGQIVDPRTGQILKGEVNMYHNIMDLQRRWYFVQVSPLDPRAQRLPLPDSLMGRLVEYVVTHEIGHSIGFPHNMKASAMYPADSIRSRAFLERMGGHVATLMDYSRFNYVAQPEDNIPPELLIPQVGPYDKYAVRWGYRPILDAKTPDDELPTLDRWSREQDTIPWFRFSTNDAPNDPENLTEAVGDADAVKSTGLALKNLARVMKNLRAATETPGEDYELMSGMYDEAVSQWGRYMRHVAAIIGGAITQEKLGTGPRFTPVAEARQREAMQFLATNAFQVPAMFLDPDILWRLEARGGIDRIRSAQTSLVSSLLQASKLNTLIEYEALTKGNTYTLAEYLGDMRKALWSELDRPTVTVDIHRRNLQRAFLDRVDQSLNPAPAAAPAGLPPGFSLPAATPVWGNDVRAMFRAELATIDRALAAAQGRAGDAVTRVHLADLRTEIKKIQDGKK